MEKWIEDNIHAVPEKQKNKMNAENAQHLCSDKESTILSAIRISEQEERAENGEAEGRCVNYIKYLNIMFNCKE